MKPSRPLKPVRPHKDRFARGPTSSRFPRRGAGKPFNPPPVSRLCHVCQAAVPEALVARLADANGLRYEGPHPGHQPTQRRPTSEAGVLWRGAKTPIGPSQKEGEGGLDVRRPDLR
jgi:hypothetical protein